MKIIKENTCPGLSGKNTITYEIAQGTDKTLSLRLVKSSGGGFVCKEWVAISALVKTLVAQSPTFTSYALHQHFLGKSTNSAAFMMAVLKQEGFIKPSSDKRQAFVGNDLETALLKLQEQLCEKSPPQRKKRATPAKPK